MTYTWAGPASLDWVVSLINGFGTRQRREAGEPELEHPDPATLPDAPRWAGELTVDDHVAVADRLDAVLEAPSVELATAALDRSLVDASPRVRATVADGGVRVGWAADEPRDALLAVASLTLLDVLVDPDLADRLGTCAAERCCDVFVDRSPAGSRRFCSTTCQTRTKVAAFRRRQRER